MDGILKMNEKKKFVAIKVKKGVYESLVEMKKTLIQQGYDTFPKDFLDFLKEDDFDITKVTFGNLIKLANEAILYLFKKENNGTKEKGNKDS